MLLLLQIAFVGSMKTYNEIWKSNSGKCEFLDDNDLQVET
jgi:hypothetical protein